MSTKTKPTLQQKLAKRKYHIPSRFIHTLYRVIMSGIVARKYNPRYEIVDKVSDCKGPCFVIWNHLSRLDHAFVMAAAWPRRINILAGYNEFFRSHLALVFRLENIIPKKNYIDDFNSVRAMNSIIKQGGCIAFAPEGMSSIYGQNQPIIAGTGRFLQFYHIPVYYVNIKGSYLTSTKVCLDERYGRVDVKCSLLFTPEQLEAMAPEEIDAKINEAFRHDDYAWGKEQHIKWKNSGNMCEKLNEICYKCPRCGAEMAMEAGGNTIRCSKCGNGATVDDYYEFHPLDGDCVIPEFPTKWVEMERKAIIDEIRRDPSYSFSFHTKLGCLPEYKLVKSKKVTSVVCGEGDFTIDHSGLHYRGTKHGEPWQFDLDYKAVFSIPIVTDTSYFSLYVGKEFHDFFPDAPVVGKLLLLTEEMHRLHENYFKNFPWYDWMYE